MRRPKYDDSSGDVQTVAHHFDHKTRGGPMRVTRLMAVGIGVGACGGFVAGLLRPRPGRRWGDGCVPGRSTRYQSLARANLQPVAVPAGGHHTERPTPGR